MPITSQKQIAVKKDVTIENGYYKDGDYRTIEVKDTQTTIIHIWQNSTMLELKNNDSITVGDWIPCTKEDYKDAVVKARNIISSIL